MSLQSCCFRVNFYAEIYNAMVVFKEAENEALFSAPYYRPVGQWTSLDHFSLSKVPITNLACYFYSTLSSIRLRRTESQSSRMFFSL